ncbi:MAG: hypothetical protein YK1309IOTA_300002 [Marine Group I thaumarchaeote]|nr:MAG: hypothetical protein YK1309IOTA_300002 [Marine Group I thaumarchaeote]
MAAKLNDKNNFPDSVLHFTSQRKKAVRHCCAHDPMYIVEYDSGSMGVDVVLVCSSCIQKFPWNKAVLSKIKIINSE